MSSSNIPPVLCAPRKIFYTNGMTASEAEANTQRAEIERIAQTEVELHHNNTTPAAKTAEMAGKLVVGIIGLTYAVSSKKNSDGKKWLDTAVGTASVALIIWALYDYYDIQQQKNESADALSHKVVNHLSVNYFSNVTLIFHSQGADIGQRTLARLVHFRDRINVITIGGMVDIPNCFADRVVNFQHMDDLVSRLANFIFDNQSQTKTKVITAQGPCETMTCHGASDYLRTELIARTIKDFTQPTYWIFDPLYKA